MEREQRPRRPRRSPPWFGSVYRPSGRTLFYMVFKDRSGKWRSRSTGLKATPENWSKAQAILEAIREELGLGHIKRPRLPKYLHERNAAGSGRRRAAYKTAHGIVACEACGWAPPDGLGPSVLNAHHVKPRASGGDDSDENLVALCPNCHATAHALLRAHQRHTKAELVLALMALRKVA